MKDYSRLLPVRYALRWASAFVTGVILLASTSAPSSAQTRYGNLVNERFATISNGPQSAVIVDIPTNASPTEINDRVTKATRADWTARSRALTAQVKNFKSVGILKGNAGVPVSTLVFTRKSGRVVLPPRGPRTRAFGGDTRLTFRFQGFDERTQNILVQFAALAYPRIEALYGKPAASGEVLVQSAGQFEGGSATDIQRYVFGAYFVSENRILLPEYQSSETFLLAFLLNMIHSFHGPAVLQYDAWEQGFARAAAAVIARDPVLGFSDPSANSLFSLLRFYDIWNQPALGNSTFFPPSQANTPLDFRFGLAKMLLPRIGMSGAAWLKVYIENQQFFRQFNEAYYAQLDPNQQPSLAGNVPALRGIAGQSLPNGVEGIPWDSWYPQQYVLDTSISVGTKLYAGVFPGEFTQDRGQSSAIALVHYRTLPNGDETLLNGRAYGTYFDDENNRIGLGISSEQASFGEDGQDGEAFLTTSSAPTSGEDAGRITLAFHVGNSNASARTYLPNGFSGDFQAVLLGPNAKGNVEVTQITLPPVNSRSKTTNLDGGAFGVSLGSQPNDLAVTVVRVSDGGVTKDFRINTGDGQCYAILRTGSNGGGVVTLNRVFPTNTVPYLVTFPLRPLAPQVDQALGLPGSDFLLSYWDPTRQPSAYETLIPGLPSVAPIQPGRGYWLKIAPTNFAPQAAVSITGIAPPTDTDFTVPCVYGWNMIGSPFSQPIDLSKLQVLYLQNEPISWEDAVQRDLVSADVYGLDLTTDTGYATFNALNGGEWQGYWLRVLVPTGVTIQIPGPDSPTTRVIGQAQSLMLTRSVGSAAKPRPDWSVRLSAQQEGLKPAVATLGAAKGATRAYDRYLDQELPPAIVPGLTLEFVHSTGDWGKPAGGRSIADYRSAENARANSTWDVAVSTPKAGIVTLNWSNVGTVPRGTRLTLVDKTTKERIAIRSRPSYSFTADGKTRQFSLLAEAALSRPLAITNLVTRPTRAAAGGRGGGMSIGYVVTGDAEVTVDLQTLGGKMLRRLQTGRTQSAGQQTIFWDGRSVDNHALPAGPYLLEITARGEDGAIVRQKRSITVIN